MQLISKWYSNNSIPRNIVQTLLDDITNFNDSFLNILKQKVLNDITNFNPSKNTEEYNKIFNVISNPFINTKTEYFRLQTLESMYVLIRPIQVVVGEQLNDILQNGRVMLEPKTVKNHRNSSQIYL